MKKNPLLHMAAAAMLVSGGAAFAQSPQGDSELPNFLVPAGPGVSLPPGFGGHPAPVQPVSAGPAPQAAPVLQPQPALPGVGLPPQSPAPVAAAPQTPSELSFQQVLKGLLPLEREQIETFRRRKDETERSWSTPVNGAPKPVTRSVAMSLRPGEQPTTLKLFAGNATTLTFSDQTGAPWPVSSVTIGNPEAYKPVPAGELGKTNMVVISPLQQHTVATNLVVSLANNPVPVIFSLATGQGEVDYRVDVGLRGRGPNAAQDIITTSSLSATNDSIVQAFIDGTPPKGARSLGSSNRDIEAWKLNDIMYVRTSMELLSPAYTARARHVSGVNIYTLNVEPVLYVSQNGQTSMVMINENGRAR